MNAILYGEMDVRSARADYFETNGFGDDGGYAKKWVKLEFGRFGFSIPNTPGRVRAVKIHDIHHIVTGYPTTPTGEAEIGAWEVASGCGGYAAAWALNLWALAYGVWLAPRAMFQAFVRGRHSGNLYREGGFADAMLDERVSALRSRLPVPADAQTARATDAIAFAGWTGVAWLWTLIGLAVLLAPLFLGARALLA
jgi:hypothetical protein